MRGFGIGKPLRGSATIVGARRGDIALGSVARSRLSHVTLSENGEPGEKSRGHHRGDSSRTS